MVINSRFVSVAAFVVLSAGGLWHLFTGQMDRTATRPPPPVPVRVAKVETGAVIERIEAIGTVRANESMMVTAKVTETVAEIRFQDGQRVDKGQILVVLSDEEQKALLARSEADLVAAEQQLRRITRLHQKGNATEAALEQITARRAALNADILAIKARLKDRIIRAPFSGIVGIRQVSPGALIIPGTAIAPLDDLSVMKVDFSVPETAIGAVKTDQEITARVAAFAERAFKGRVQTIGTRVDEATRAATVRAVLDNSELLLKPGMLATIEIVHARRQSISVAEESIVPVSDRSYVFVAENGVARRVAVTLGIREPGKIEIVSGLEVGQSIIVEGTSRVRNGAKIVVQGEGKLKPATSNNKGS